MIGSVTILIEKIKKTTQITNKKNGFVCSFHLHRRKERKNNERKREREREREKERQRERERDRERQRERRILRLRRRERLTATQRGRGRHREAESEAERQRSRQNSHPPRLELLPSWTWQAEGNQKREYDAAWQKQWRLWQNWWQKNSAEPPQSSPEGRWMKNQRQRRGKLANWQVALLEANPNWKWESR